MQQFVKWSTGVKEMPESRCSCKQDFFSDYENYSFVPCKGRGRGELVTMKVNHILK